MARDGISLAPRTQLMERLLLERNERHLQQTAIEEGVSTKPPMTHLRENFGFNDTASRALQGTYEFKEEVSDEVAALFQTLKRTDAERECPPILGTISSAGRIPGYVQDEEKAHVF